MMDIINICSVCGNLQFEDLVNTHRIYKNTYESIIAQHYYAHVFVAVCDLDYINCN